MKINEMITYYVEAKQSADKDYVFNSEFCSPRFRSVPEELQQQLDDMYFNEPDYSRSEEIKGYVIENLTHITAGLSMDLRKAESLCKDIALLTAREIVNTEGKEYDAIELEDLDKRVLTEDLTELKQLNELADFIRDEYDGIADLESETFEACCNIVGISASIIFDNFFGYCGSIIEDELDRRLGIRSTSAKYNFANLEVDVDFDLKGMQVFIYDPKG